MVYNKKPLTSPSQKANIVRDSIDSLLYIGKGKLQKYL